MMQWSSLPPSLPNSSRSQQCSKSLSGYQWMQSNTSPIPAPSHSQTQGTTTSIRPGGHPDANEVDLLQKCGQDAILQAVYTPPEADSWQAPVVYVDYTRSQLSAPVLSCLEVRPNTVILHVYDLNPGLAQANELTGFHAGFGGAFHAGVEVYGGEWAYGVCGVDCELPRSTTSHAYKCSVIVGCTQMDRRQVAEVLQSLLVSWRGAEYDVLGRNCCTFAAEFCERLGCEALPPWVDRFPRLLHGGQQAGLQAQNRVQEFTSRTSQYAQELPSKVQPHVDYAAKVGNRMILASQAAMQQADYHANRLMAGLWENVQYLSQQGWKAGEEPEELETNESVVDVVHESSILDASAYQPTSGSPNGSLFGPLPPLQPWKTNFDTKSTLPAYPALDSTATLPAYPGFSRQPSVASDSYLGLTTAPSLVSPNPIATASQTPMATGLGSQITNPSFLAQNAIPNASQTPIATGLGQQMSYSPHVKTTPGACAAPSAAPNYAGVSSGPAQMMSVPPVHSGAPSAAPNYAGVSNSLAQMTPAPQRQNGSLSQQAHISPAQAMHGMATPSPLEVGPSSLSRGFGASRDTNSFPSMAPAESFASTVKIDNIASRPLLTNRDVHSSSPTSPYTVSITDTPSRALR